jgi:hypothetical protein
MGYAIGWVAKNLVHMLCNEIANKWRLQILLYKASHSVEILYRGVNKPSLDKPGLSRLGSFIFGLGLSLSSSSSLASLLELDLTGFELSSSRALIWVWIAEENLKMSLPSQSGFWSETIVVGDRVRCADNWTTEMTGDWENERERGGDERLRARAPRRSLSRTGLDAQMTKQRRWEETERTRERGAKMRD